MKAETIDAILNDHNGEYECAVHTASVPLEGKLTKLPSGVYQVEATVQQMHPQTRQPIGPRLNSKTWVEAEDIKAIQKIEPLQIQPVKSILHP